MKLFDRIRKRLKEANEKRLLTEKPHPKPRKYSPTPRYLCRECGEPISEEQYEEFDELCEECYEYLDNQMEEEEFDSI